MIENAEEDLDKEMDVLKEETRLRNLEIKKRLDKIKAQQQDWREKLQVEKHARDRADAALSEHFQHRFDALSADMMREVHQVFDELEQKNLPPSQERERVWYADFRHFVDVQVPGIIEDLQGSVTRQLQKSHETFDIDNTKLMKREKRLVERFESHQKNAQVCFQVEQEKRKEKFTSIRHDIHETTRTDDRQSEMRQCEILQTLKVSKDEMLIESQVREQEDLQILGNLAKTMVKLQSSILTNFGEEAE